MAISAPFVISFLKVAELGSVSRAARALHLSQPAVSKQRARREADPGRNAGPHQDGFFPGAPQMLRERLGPLSPEAKHQVLAGGALGFYGLS